MMKKPYLKKIRKIGNYTAWLVDGNYVRKNIDEEFTNYGHHYKFKFIPENEFWIDHENVAGEEKYYIDNMLAIMKSIKKGKTYNEAVLIAEKVEKTERKKSKLAKRAHKKLIRGKDSLKDIYKKKIKPKNCQLKVWIVDGEFVRDEFFIDFTEGGHDKVYHFIPHNEIWIDNDVAPKERNFVLLHEIHERNLMAKGWEYERAHADSSHIEFFCRHHPKKTRVLLNREFKKLSKIKGKN